MQNKKLDIGEEKEEFGLKDFLLRIVVLTRFLIANWKIIFVFGLIGATVGVAYALLKKPIFKAELTFALEDEKSSAGGLGSALGLASQFGIDLGGAGGGGAFSGDNLLTLMKSRAMVEQTLLKPVLINGKQKTLAERYIDFNHYRDKWSGSPNLQTLNFLPGTDRSKFTLTQDSVLGNFFKAIIKTNLSVDKVDKKLSIITVVVNSEDEMFSKIFTELLVKTVGDFYIETKTKKSTQNVNILQRQADSVRNRLNMAITGVASSTDVNPNANPALQILRAPSQRKQVDVQANQAILTELVKNLEISKVSLRKETPLIQEIDIPILPLEKYSVGKTKAFILGFIAAAFLSSFFILMKKIFVNALR
ncbi:lipopolysaccharide biosynthesis protein [Mucilaginibacter sp.]|uniref:lipopolysaccharide biosynthesis protein n=1 Tax=Mucilaginibacter sp. TaxID=1882438 RepID=UPI0035BBD7BD